MSGDGARVGAGFCPKPRQSPGECLDKILDGSLTDEPLSLAPGCGRGAAAAPASDKPFQPTASNRLWAWPTDPPVISPSAAKASTMALCWERSSASLGLLA